MSAPQFTLLVPKNTLETAPAELLIKLFAGQVTAISVMFHNGANTMVNVSLYDNLKQIAPGIEGQSWAWNGAIQTFPLVINVPDLGKTIRVLGWSPNTLYQHNVRFWFHMLSDEEIREAKELPLQSLLLPYNEFIE